MSLRDAISSPEPTQPARSRGGDPFLKMNSFGFHPKTVNRFRESTVNPG